MDTDRDNFYNRKKCGCEGVRRDLSISKILNQNFLTTFSENQSHTHKSHANNFDRPGRGGAVRISVGNGESVISWGR